MNDRINLKLNEWNASLNEGVNFIIDRLKNFNFLPLDEQLAYLAILIGFLMILVSIVLFII